MTLGWLVEDRSAKVAGETAFESRELVEGVVATFGLERADALQDRGLRFVASSRDQQEIGGAVVHPPHLFDSVRRLLPRWKFSPEKASRRSQYRRETRPLSGHPDAKASLSWR